MTQARSTTQVVAKAREAIAILNRSAGDEENPTDQVTALLLDIVVIATRMDTPAPVRTRKKGTTPLRGSEHLREGNQI